MNIDKILMGIRIHFAPAYGEEQAEKAALCIAELQESYIAALEVIKRESGCWECDVREQTGCEEAFYANSGAGCKKWKWRGRLKE